MSKSAIERIRPAYTVAFLDPQDNELKISQSCTDGAAIAAAVRFLCATIEWDPLKHYEDNFYEMVQDTTELDAGQFALIDLWEHELIAAIVIIRDDFIDELKAGLDRLDQDEHTD